LTVASSSHFISQALQFLNDLNAKMQPALTLEFEEFKALKKAELEQMGPP